MVIIKSYFLGLNNLCTQIENGQGSSWQQTAELKFISLR